MLRRQPTLLLFLASAVAFGALAAWALAPVQEHSSSSSLSSRWKSVKVSLVGRDPLDPLDKEKRRKQESCPRGVEVGADVECPPHKSETHYKKYSVREYYGGVLRWSEREREKESNVIVDKARDAEKKLIPFLSLPFFSLTSTHSHNEKNSHAPLNRRLGDHQDPICAPRARRRERCVFCSFLAVARLRQPFPSRGLSPLTSFLSPPLPLLSRTRITSTKATPRSDATSTGAPFKRFEVLERNDGNKVTLLVLMFLAEKDHENDHQ